MADPQPQIIVSKAATGAMVAAAIRGITLLLAGGVAILGFIRQRDLPGLVNYLQSQSFAPVAGVIVAGATLLVGQYSAFRKHRDAVTMATGLPDEVAIVEGQPGDQTQKPA